MWEALAPAGSYVRSSDLHQSVHPVGSREAGF